MHVVGGLKLQKKINSTWRRPPFEIRFIAHNSVGVSYISTKFGM